jgi:hypothetical protein
VHEEEELDGAETLGAAGDKAKQHLKQKAPRGRGFRRPCFRDQVCLFDSI